MYCEKCGKKVDEYDKFCTECGNKLKTNQSISERNIKFVEKENVVKEDKLLLNVKPKFSLGYILLPYIIAAAIFFIVGQIASNMGDAGSRVNDSLNPYNISTNLISDYVADMNYLISGAFLIVGSMVSCITAVAYTGFTYDFYNSKIVYKDGFANRVEKEVKYKYIKEVEYAQTFYQRMFGIGNIYISTNASSMRNGIKLSSVYNVAEVYKKVKGIIDNKEE